ncbi:OprD family porin [Pseudomonas sp. MHK4]|jgi:hypothetical protein
MKAAQYVTALLLSHATCSIASGFVEDSSATLALRNFYMDRDFRDGSGQSQAQEWAQGFQFNFSSGFTPGTLGFGVNTLAMAGFKLDSSPDRTGTGLLPYDTSDREPRPNYSKAGVAGKARISKTELQIGSVTTLVPVAFPVTARLFAPYYEGATLQSKEIDNLTINAASFDRQIYRDSTNGDKLRVSSPNNRFIGSAESDSFYYGGAEYQWNPSLKTSYYFAQLQDIYTQHFVGATHKAAIGSDSLTTEAYLFRSLGDGAERAGNVDNYNFNINLSYRHKAHTFSLGHMRLSGESAMPYLAGTDPYLIVGGSLVSEYINPDERVWQAKYQYDFAAMAIPGLTGMIRVVRGDNVHLPQYDWSGSEWERDIELAYVIQQGTFSGVAFRVRQGHYQSDFARNVDETRLNIDYTFKLW